MEYLGYLAFVRRSRARHLPRPRAHASLHLFFVLIRFLRRYYLARHKLRDRKTGSGAEYVGNRRKLIAELSQGLGTLNAIASTAPFLGLAGTCYGIMGGAFMGFSMEKHTAMLMLMTNIAASLATAAAGILVAIPAVLSHNFIRTRADALHYERPLLRSVSDELAVRLRSIRFAQTLPLRKAFSSLPPFAIVAAPALSCLIALFAAFEPYTPPTGLRVLLPSFPCQPGVLSDRIIVLRVTQNGELFINMESVSWADLPRRLSAIYSTRARRELYLRADDGVPFQTVADAIDTATKIRTPEFNSLDINVLLITPQAEAESERCIERSLDRHGRHFLRK